MRPCDSVPTLSLRDGLRAVRLKLWDEQQGKLVGFRAARGARVGAELTTTPLRPTPR